MLSLVVVQGVRGHFFALATPLVFQTDEEALWWSWIPWDRWHEVQFQLETTLCLAYVYRIRRNFSLDPPGNGGQQCGKP